MEDVHGPVVAELHVARAWHCVGLPAVKQVSADPERQGEHRDTRAYAEGAQRQLQLGRVAWEDRWRLFGLAWAHCERDDDGGGGVDDHNRLA